MHIKSFRFYAYIALSLFPSLLGAASPFFSIPKREPQEKKETRGEYEQRSGSSQKEIKSDCSRIKTDLAFLIWQAQEDGLEFAARNNPRFPLSATIPTDISASLTSVDFSWEPAFKFLLGYHFSPSAWDLNIRWTWFHSRSTRSLSQPLSSSGAGLFPLWIAPQAAIATFPVYTNAKGKLMLLLNSFDFELGATQTIFQSLLLKVHGGLKGLSLHQNFHVKYSGGFSDGVNQMLESNTQARLRSSGLGPRIGFSSRWLLPYHLAFIAETAGALILSDIKTKRDDQAIGTISSTPRQITIDFHQNFWVWRPILEGKAGLQWEHWFGCKKSTVLNLEFAYEIQHYWEQNNFTRYGDAAIFYGAFNNRGNLTLHGFSFTAAWGY